MINKKLFETNLHNNINLPKKRRLISCEEFKHDFKNEIENLDLIFNNAKKEYYDIRSNISEGCLARGFLPIVFSTIFFKHCKKHFPEKGKFQKQKRFIIELNGYLLLFKKFNDKNKPMYHKSKNNEIINNQLEFDFTGDTKQNNLPVIYIGYQTDKLGIISDLIFTYMDDDVVKWVLHLCDFYSKNAEIDFSNPEIDIDTFDNKLKFKDDEQNDGDLSVAN